KLSPACEHGPVVSFTDGGPKIDQAARDNNEAEIEGKKSGFRTFQAPADSHLHAADNDNDAEERRRDGNADFDIIVCRTDLPLSVGMFLPVVFQDVSGSS